MSDGDPVYRSMTLEEWLSLENVEDIMPNIVGHYKESSKAVLDYNCLSWAVERTDAFLDPQKRSVGYDWPPGVEREWTVTACTRVLAHYGYSERCTDESFEDEYVKVAMYVDKDGLPTHFARQIQGDKWTSKLGDLIDVVHDDLKCLAGHDFQHYGTVAHYFKKKAPKAIWPPTE